MKRQADTHIIQSLDKGLLLLETIESSPSPLGLKDLALKLRWDKATLHRLLLTLERRGYVLRDQETKRYTLGLKIYALYDSLVQNFDIQQTTRPLMKSVAEQTGETTHLAVAAGADIVFIDRTASMETLSVNTQIGSHEPMFCTALGRAILAFLPEEQLAQCLPSSLPRYTPRTITSLQELRTTLKKIREQGYATDIEEYVAGIRCIAAPILDHEGTPVAALGVSGPSARIPIAKVKRYGFLIREAACETSRRAGWTEPATSPTPEPAGSGASRRRR